MGAGRVDLAAYLRGNLSTARMGVLVDAEKRVSTNLSAFGQGWVGTDWSRDTGWETDYGIVGGVRLRF